MGKVRFEFEEMIGYWERRLGLGAGVGLLDLEDATGARKRLEEAVEGWYAGLLRGADPELVHTEDFGQQALLRMVEPGVMGVSFPDRGVRMVSVKLSEWTYAIERAYERDSDVGRLQESKWLRGSVEAPVALRTYGGLLLYGVRERAPGEPLRLESLIMTARAADGSFEIDEGLLAESEILI